MLRWKFANCLQIGKCVFFKLISIREKLTVKASNRSLDRCRRWSFWHFGRWPHRLNKCHLYNFLACQEETRLETYKNNPSFLPSIWKFSLNEVESQLHLRNSNPLHIFAWVNGKAISTEGWKTWKSLPNSLWQKSYKQLQKSDSWVDLGVLSKP